MFDSFIPVPDYNIVRQTTRDSFYGNKKQQLLNNFSF